MYYLLILRCTTFLESFRPKTKILIQVNNHPLLLQSKTDVPDQLEVSVARNGTHTDDKNGTYDDGTVIHDLDLHGNIIEKGDPIAKKIVNCDKQLHTYCSECIETKKNEIVCDKCKEGYHLVKKGTDIGTCRDTNAGKYKTLKQITILLISLVVISCIVEICFKHKLLPCCCRERVKIHVAPTREPNAKRKIKKLKTANTLATIQYGNFATTSPPLKKTHTKLLKKSQEKELTPFEKMREGRETVNKFGLIPSKISFDTTPSPTSTKTVKFEKPIVKKVISSKTIRFEEDNSKR